jgi:hypothetical protein
LLKAQTHFAQVPLEVVMKIAAVKPEHEMQMEVPKSARRKVGTGKRTKRGPGKKRTFLSK